MNFLWQSKKVKQEIVGPLSIIISTSMEAGECTQKLKETKVTAIKNERASHK